MKRLKECFIHDAVSPNFLRREAEKLCGQFDVKSIGHLFASFKKTDKFCKLQHLITFCVDEKVDLIEVDGNYLLEIDHLIHTVEVNQLTHKYYSDEHKPDHSEKNKFSTIFQQLKTLDWNYAKLKDLQKYIQCTHELSDFIDILRTLLFYNLPSSYFEKVKNLLKSSETFLKSLKEVNKLCIEHYWQQQGKEKDSNELLIELKNTNQCMDDRAIDEIESKKSKVDEWISKKSTWKEKDIQNWAKKVKSNVIHLNENEAIAVIYQGNFLITSHKLTHTQIFCCLLALEKNLIESKKGKLFQVATGEGKSTIICILAIINALKGKKVDVITSSPVLAERDVNQKSKLYSLFGLSCASNRDRAEYFKGTKNCYKADIVYGDMSQFQFDILRNDYSRLGTLGGRKQVIAIVDEVDSMLIDDTTKIARLSSTMPGMSNFQPIYALIWCCLDSIDKKLISFNHKTYYVDGEVSFEKNKITLDVTDRDGNVATVPDLEYLVTNTTSDFHEIVDDVDEFLRRKLTEFLDCKLKEINFYISSNFVDFIKNKRQNG